MAWRSVAVGCLVTVVALAGLYARQRTPPGPAPDARPAVVEVPFHLIRGLIAVPVILAGEPATMLFDTGAKPSIIDLGVARRRGLSLTGRVRAGGTGESAVEGAFVATSFRIGETSGTDLAVTLAIPLDRVSRRLGHRIAGIIGLDATRGWVVEIDYGRHRLRLHDRARFSAPVTGVTVPLGVDANGHPTLAASIAMPGGARVPMSAKLDLGNTGSFVLHTPFVSRYGLPGPGPTWPLLGSGGLAGASHGVIGRVPMVEVGGVEFADAIVSFSSDTTGAYADGSIDAHLGARVARHFRWFLDLDGRRAILVPSGDRFALGPQASAGVVVECIDDTLAVYAVTDVQSGGAGAEAGLAPGDRIEMIDGQPASTVPLATLLDRFERTTPVGLTVARGVARLTMTVRPRGL